MTVTGAAVDGALAFVVATDFEMRIVRRGLRRAGSGTAFSLLECGIGYRVDGALDSLGDCSCVVSCGFAAGLADGVGAGTIVLPESLVDPHGDVRPVSARWHARIRERVGDGPVVGPLIHTAEILTGPRDKRAAAETGPSVAADMESWLIAGACAERRLPFVALRVVLDPVDVAVPHAVIASAAGGAKPDVWRFARALLARPADWRDALVLAGHTITASRSLMAALARL